MRLRKSIVAPLRYEDDDDIEYRSKNPTRPAFPRLLKEQAIPFDLDYEPAAFPSLLLKSADTTSVDKHNDSEPLSTVNTCEESDSDADTDNDTEMKDCAEAELDFDLSIFRSSPVQTKPSILPDNHSENAEQVVAWKTLDPCLQYRIFSNLCKEHPSHKVAELLQLDEKEVNDIKRIQELRKKYPATTNEIWKYAINISEEANGYIDPEVMKQYMDYLVFAGQYEYVFETQIGRAREFLKDLDLSEEIAGIWMPDPGGSAYFTEISESASTTMIDQLNYISVEGSTQMTRSYENMYKHGSSDFTGPYEAGIAHMQASIMHEQQRTRQSTESTDAGYEDENNTLKRTNKKKHPPPLILKYRKRVQPVPSTDATTASNSISAMPTSDTGIPLSASSSNFNSTFVDSAATTSVNTPSEVEVGSSTGPDIGDVAELSDSGSRKAGRMSLRNRGSLKETEALAAMRESDDYWGHFRGGGGTHSESGTSESSTKQLTLKIDRTGFARIVDASTNPTTAEQLQDVAAAPGSQEERSIRTAETSPPYYVQHGIDEPDKFASHFVHSGFPKSERSRLLSIEPSHRSNAMTWLIYGQQRLEEMCLQTLTSRLIDISPTADHLTLDDKSTGSVVTDNIVSRWNLCSRLKRGEHYFVSSGMLELAVEEGLSLVKIRKECAIRYSQCAFEERPNVLTTNRQCEDESRKNFANRVCDLLGDITPETANAIRQPTHRPTAHSTQSSQRFKTGSDNPLSTRFARRGPAKARKSKRSLTDKFLEVERTNDGFITLPQESLDSQGIRPTSPAASCAKVTPEKHAEPAVDILRKIDQLNSDRFSRDYTIILEGKGHSPDKISSFSCTNINQTTPLIHQTPEAPAYSPIPENEGYEGFLRGDQVHRVQHSFSPLLINQSAVQRQSRGALGIEVLSNSAKGNHSVIPLRVNNRNSSGNLEFLTPMPEAEALQFRYSNSSKSNSVENGFEPTSSEENQILFTTGNQPLFPVASGSSNPQTNTLTQSTSHDATVKSNPGNGDDAITNQETASKSQLKTKRAYKSRAKPGGLIKAKYEKTPIRKGTVRRQTDKDHKDTGSTTPAVEAKKGRKRKSAP